jgi:3-methylcrotonyl-CoA carboxylase alpha subunit
MFQRLLIANRGEIACRIARTARRLAVATVAIYSDADACAQHVALADEAWRIGPAPARDSYLAIDKILDVARRSRAQAVHPGYGFLAEDPDFAEACARAGLTFIGPTAEAMRLMGSKASAKAIMERAGVPTVSGYHGEGTDFATFADAAKRVGYPVLIKASAGGGGRGMRVVRRFEDLAAAMEAAEREALASFGDGQLLLEKFLTSPRHIEIQIFADSHGGVASFLERDCSLQRRHQKIMEETPATGISETLRREMRDAATAAVLAVGYVGAGTIEFLLEGDKFYFLEMNARLQVEHPITEMIAGQDLVEWQFRIACGERLPLAQGELVMRGCAMEARICAENPAQGFLPSVGQIKHLHFPKQDAAVRIDAGVRQGDWITQYYDSLIAKLVVWAENRQETLQRLRDALNLFELAGVDTNLDLLRAIANDSHVASGEFGTAFVEGNLDRLILKAPISESDERFILAAATSAWLDELKQREEARSIESSDAWSPWSLADGWRIDGGGHYDISFDFDGRRLAARIWPPRDGGFRLEALAMTAAVVAKRYNDRMRLRVDGVEREIEVVRDANAFVVIVAGRNYRLRRIDPLQPSQSQLDARMQMSAPIPGKVIGLLVDTGDKVKAGAPLVILEAMKMEITLRAPRDAVIGEVRCALGDMTTEGAELIVLAEDDR